MDIYAFAIQHNIPVLSHTIRGVVHYRGKKQETWGIHPVTGNPLPEKKPSQFSANFTHPLNVECLLNQKLLQIYFDKEGLGDAPDLKNLKICLAHFGGDDEWKNFLQDPWLPDSSNILDTADPYRSLDVSLWNKPEGAAKYSWFSIVCDLIKKYDNVYADISYTLADKSLIPLLKVALSDEKIRRRVLFGTDFYVVAKETTEREFSIELRAALGEELFHQIAYTNPKKYLSSRLNPNV
jgi:predicted TIM-barrel fold metal-dependent hydrolase